MLKPIFLKTTILLNLTFVTGYRFPSSILKQRSLQTWQCLSAQKSETTGIGLVRDTFDENTQDVITSTSNSSGELPKELDRFSRRGFIDQSSTLMAVTIFGYCLPNEANAANIMDEDVPYSVMNSNKLDENQNYRGMFSTSLITSDASIPIKLEAPRFELKPILEKSAKRALGGGKAGALASAVQVFTLMWLRTAMNYQYRYGGDLSSSLQTLWKEGGIGRLYQGLPFALVQGPLTRFGDTAANVGILALLESFPETASLPLPVKTICGSIAAGSWRIVCMPIDTSKTAMQVKGSQGLYQLKEKVLAEGPSPLYQGAIASAVATAVGHFPWYLTFNSLNEMLPEVSKDMLLLYLARSAIIGCAASCVSDCCSNSVRVLKTTKQTAALEQGESKMSYKDILAQILEEDGLKGLFGRGLQTRLLTNAIQGSVFSVLWKYFQST